MIYLVEITAYDPSLPGTKILRYSSGSGFTTGPAETPANTFYEPRIVQPCSFTTQLFSDARVMGGSSAGYGEIVLNNADNALSFFLNYGLDGRSCIVRVGQDGAAYPGGFTTFLNGTMQAPEVSASKVTVRIRDASMVLTLPVQQTLYAGSNVLPNGAEGGSDIQGQPKPLLYGHVYNAPAVLVNTASLIYQVHDGAIAGIDGVYDGGSLLTAGGDVANLAALQPNIVGTVDVNQPAAGAYKTCLALGLFRLGSLAGRVTATVRGDNSGGYVNTVAGIVKRILTQRAGISAATIDASFTALDSIFGAECGIFIGQSTTGADAPLPQTSAARPIITSAVAGGSTCQDAIAAVLLSGGCWLAPTRTGTWSIGQLVAPSGSPVATFDDIEILSIDSQTTSDPTAGLPVWAVVTRYRRYPGALQAAEVSQNIATSTPDVAADLTYEWRVYVGFAAGVLTTHLLAPMLFRDTCLANKADATTETTRLLALHQVRRDFVRAKLRLDETNAAIDKASIISLQTPRLGYDAGRLFVVIGSTSDGINDELTLDLWG